jgi:nucleotide-binding universal stress UspA family protein
VADASDQEEFMSVVVGYAERPECERALEAGAEQARLRELPLHVVHIAKVGAGQESSDDIVSHRARLAKIEQYYRGQGLECHAQEIFAQGRVSEAFLAAAAERGAKLVVIGIRSRSAVGKLLVGSIAQEVIMAAPCPVLAVKPGGPSH